MADQPFDIIVVGCGAAGLYTMVQADMSKQVLAAKLDPEGGKVLLDGRDWSFTPPARRGIAMVMQNYALFPHLSVAENVGFGLRRRRPGRMARIQECLELVDLASHGERMPHELSGGQRQRVGFARALAISPDILLLDEPFSALDILTSDTLKNDFLDLWVAKKTNLKSVIIVTHSIEEAVMMADRVLILEIQCCLIHFL